jgi:Fe-S cluster assembly ATP-binding protein
MAIFLSISDLKVNVEGISILKGIDLNIKMGEVHAIMGPNGSGKSTLAYTLMGHPSYKVVDGVMMLDGDNIGKLSPDKRAKLGVFLAFQYPHEIEGVRFFDFLRQSYNALYSRTDKQLGLGAFRKLVYEKLDMLKMNHDFIERSLNVGFSGGEKKRAETLQLAVLQPKLVILDEIDSGLDIDALGIVCEGINTLKRSNPDMTFIIITHHNYILKYLKPDVVHVMSGGKIIRSGNMSLSLEVEKKGYNLY